MASAPQPSSQPASNKSASLQDKRPQFLGHPTGLFLLFMVEMWERFSYYGMRGLLVLYLTAALAAHQVAKGTYTNTLRVTQSYVATEAEEAKGIEPESVVTDIPLKVVVGDSAAAQVDLAALENAPKSLLKFDQLGKQGDGKWNPIGAEGLKAPTFSAKAGERPAGDAAKYRVTNANDRKVSLSFKLLRPYPDAEIQKRIAAARAEPIEPKELTEQIDALKKKDATKSPDQLSAAARESILAAKEKAVRDADNPDYKVYFKVNDSTSVVSTNITPEAKRDKQDPPFELSIDINRIDSGRSWTKADANTVYGWYTGMAYLLPILGGLIADKLIGTHRSMIVGALLITMGHLALGVSGMGDLPMNALGMSVFVGGMALITIGTGHFKPCVSVQVGDLYPPGDPRREGAYSIFYMGINLGAFLCNLVCGALAIAYGWHYGFAAAAIGMVAGLLCYVLGKHRFLAGLGDTDSAHKNKAWLFLPMGLVLAFGVAYLFHVGVLGGFDEFVSQAWVFKLLIVAALAYGIWFIARQEKGDRGPVATIFIYMLFNAVFWLSFEQAGSSLTTFTDELTDRRSGLFWDVVPTPYFQSINPLLIIIFAPIFGVFWVALAKRGKSFGQPFKIGAGLIFVGLGYMVMFFAAQRLNTGISKVGMIYIVGCYFLHTVGEIILSPTGLSYVNKTAPKRHMSSLMGIWFISSFIAGLAAGKVAALVDPIIEGKVKLPWKFGGQSDFFLLFVVSSIAAGVLILLAAPLLIRLQRDRTD